MEKKKNIVKVSQWSIKLPTVTFYYYCFILFVYEIFVILSYELNKAALFPNVFLNITTWFLVINYAPLKWSVGILLCICPSVGRSVYWSVDQMVSNQ
jgi:hypothetical protein